MAAYGCESRHSHKTNKMREVFESITPIFLGLSLGFSIKYIETDPGLPLFILIGLIGYFFVRFAKK